MNDRFLVVVAWLVVGAVVLAGVGYIALRFIALWIARRVSERAERALTASVDRGARALGLGARDAWSPAAEASLARIDRLARVMDRVIPLPGGAGIGLDSVLGLVPGVGDAVSFVVSAYIVIRAAQLGASPALISRLIAIQCTDLVLGALPLVGDIFDMAYQADVRSAALIRDALGRKAR